jgi:hypothetical protein
MVAHKPDVHYRKHLILYCGYTAPEDTLMATDKHNLQM